MGLPGSSADTFGGWKNHFHRTRRWKDRCLAEMSQPYGRESYDTVDFALAYFVWCHSLREWLIEDAAVDRQLLDAELSRYPDWAVCRDIANRCRHFNPRRNPVDKDWTFHREFDPFANAENGRPSFNWFLVFLTDRRELREVISATFDMWTEIMRAHDLDPKIV